jgi:hypothetical protein
VGVEIRVASVRHMVNVNVPYYFADLEVLKEDGSVVDLPVRGKVFRSHLKFLGLSTLAHKLLRQQHKSIVYGLKIPMLLLVVGNRMRTRYTSRKSSHRSRQTICSLCCF